MRFIPLSLALGALIPASHVLAQEVGRVISSTPIIQQVAVPRQVCSQQQLMTALLWMERQRCASSIYQSLSHTQADADEASARLVEG